MEHLQKHPSFINTAPGVLAALFTDQATISDKVDLGRNLTFSVKDREHMWDTRSWYFLHDM